jgi:hypothetical protein
MPVQIYSSFHNYSRFSPMIFRFEDAYKGISLVEITQIISCRQYYLCEMKCIQYLCKALLNKRETTLELIYNVHQHQWMMFEPTTI